jgi:hypothetical protein
MSIVVTHKAIETVYLRTQTELNQKKPLDDSEQMMIDSTQLLFSVVAIVIKKSIEFLDKKYKKYLNELVYQVMREWIGDNISGERAQQKMLQLVEQHIPEMVSRAQTKISLLEILCSCCF